MPSLALDRMVSARTYDSDGRLRVTDAVISQSNVGKYWGHEIINADSLGLDPGLTYLMYRPVEELAKAVPSANGLPILTAHEPVDAVEFRPDLLVGATLSDARFQDPHLVCSIAIFSQDAIDEIEGGTKGSLSAAYRYRAVRKPGISPAGEPYDFVMRDIIFNHVALVDTGRIGPDAIIADRAPDWRIEERFFADFGRRLLRPAARGAQRGRVSPTFPLAAPRQAGRWRAK
jgi:uncharacterized protein